MTSFNLPSSIAITNPVSSSWNTIIPSVQVNSNYDYDTATKKHYSAAGSSGAPDIFFELNNGVITADVNTSPTGGAPDGISLTGTGSGSNSVTVTAGNTIYLHNAGWSVPQSFVWQSSWTTTSGSGGGGTSTEGVNAPYVTWNFPHRKCGETTGVSVTHTVAQSVATTYYVHELGLGQIGTILVGTGAYPSTSGSANYAFTISARTLQVKDANGSVLGTKVFSCRSRKVHSNFW